MKKRFFKTLKELQEECPSSNFRRNDSGGIIYDYPGGIVILHEEIVSNLGKEVVGDLLELAEGKEWLTKIEDIEEVDISAKKRYRCLSSDYGTWELGKVYDGDAVSNVNSNYDIQSFVDSNPNDWELVEEKEQMSITLSVDGQKLSEVLEKDCCIIVGESPIRSILEEQSKGRMVRGWDVLQQLDLTFPWDEQSEEDKEHDISEAVKQDKKDLAYQIMELSEDISERSARMRDQQDALDATCPCEYEHYAFLKLSVACNEQANEEDLLLMEELRKQYSELIE